MDPVQVQIIMVTGGSLVVYLYSKISDIEPFTKTLAVGDLYRSIIHSINLEPKPNL